MPKAGPTLAKLTRPRLHQAVARERLFARLDRGHEQKSALCIVGPPGAGKTTLAASWLDARAIDGIWYQVDSGDADLSTFFHYLGEAAKPFTRKGQRPLPALTPEYRQDIEGFARRFWRELFARLPKGAALVLDNYQEVAADQAFHRIAADAVSEVPQGQTILVLSRQDPPDCYARLIANEGVAFIDWENLKLSLEEAQAIAHLRGHDDSALVQDLYTQCAGWAAGMTLMLERPRAPGTAVTAEDASREALFAYFASLIFERADDDVQHFFVKSAYLPTATPGIAAQLTGNAAAGQILEDLYRRHLFTHRHPGAEPSYWYHALFRAFLKAQAQRLLTSDERVELQQRAARLLDARGQFEEAFELFSEAQDWEGASRVILSRAAALLAQGRGQTLREWIDALPGSLVQDNPWLGYWYGASLVASDPNAARRRLEASFTRFATLGERRWQCLAAASVIDTYFFEWIDFRPVRGWAASLGELIASVPLFESDQIELKVRSSWLLAMLYGEPGHPDRDRCADSVEQMLDLDIDINTRVSAAVFLLAYSALGVQLDRGRRVVARFGRLVDDPQVSALNRRWWHIRLGYLLWNAADYDGAWCALEESHRIAEVHGLQGLRQASVLALNYQIHVALSRRDWRAARDIYERIHALADPGRPMSDWHDLWTSILGNQRGDRPAGPDHYARLHRAAWNTGMVYVQILSRITEAHQLACIGRSERLASLVREARMLARETVFAYLENELRLIDAVAAVRSGETDGTALLTEALREARRAGYPYPTRTYSHFLSEVCSEALAAQIETDYVCSLIRLHALRAPANAPQAWSWPVKIFTLGRFEVRVDDVVLRFENRTPRKPLALLRAIVALGGRDVPRSRLIDALWKDQDGDAGKQALGVTLVRLRKLLGTHDAIEVADERISLNTDLCWVDAWTFEHRVRGAESLRSAGRPAAWVEALEDALPLYQGNFLPADADETWSVQTRLRLRGALTNAIEHLGEQLQAEEQWERAIAAYRKGLEADDLVEAFYLGLMRCYEAQCRPAEGIAVFRRLRQTLSVVLGVAPSPKSEAVAAALRAAGRIHAD